MLDQIYGEISLTYTIGTALGMHVNLRHNILLDAVFSLRIYILVDRREASMFGILGTLGKIAGGIGSGGNV